MHETSKAVARRLHCAAYASHYFVGRGIDVGAGTDSIRQYRVLFPRMTEIVDWDKPEGDAGALPGVAAGSFDWLHSSHCLEHLDKPIAALRRWCEVVRPGGYLVVMVPDEDLYEQHRWPSTWNGEHKHTFTIYKLSSWCPASVNVLDLLRHVADLALPVKVELLHATQPGGVARVDHTRNLVTESAIELVLRRLPLPVGAWPA